VLTGYLIPETYRLPVQGMNRQSFNHESFWYYPWGASVRHKGVDVFASKGTQVYSSTAGFELYSGTHPRGGKMMLILGPKWRVHHYLHLDTILTESFALVHAGGLIGRVGNTGNAIGKPAHLHYAITTLLPYPWKMQSGIQGTKRMWYIDPTPYLLKYASR
jgi:murein DD-endopeptidase MepM/ murein hydrolase activator NlpD